MEVYELVESSPADQPYFPGTVYALEVLERDTWPKLRLTMAYDGSQCLHPVVPYDSWYVFWVFPNCHKIRASSSPSC